MTWYEKQKEQAEEIRKKNRLISDNEIEAIVFMISQIVQFLITQIV